MSQRRAFSTLIRLGRSSATERHPKPHSSTPINYLPASKCLRNPFDTLPIVGTAKFSTASVQYADLNVHRGMTLEERVLSRRRLQDEEDARALEKNFTRDWRMGDVYAPHDLSAAEARKWRKRKGPTTDAFDALSLNPLDCYKNFSIMSEYMTEMGRIKHSRDTGLRSVNQRKIAKAIRRAIGVGLMPSVHRHPELIRMAIHENRKTGR